MKKSQVLAALALAFALGVTPIISTVNTASAFTVADSEKNVKGSATVDEVKNAVAAVKGQYPTYKNMVVLSDLIALTGDDAVTKVDSLSATDASNITTILVNNFGYKQTDADKITNSKNSFATQIKEAVSVAQKVKNYNTLATFWTAINDNDDKAYRDIIPTINNAFGTQLAYNSQVTVAATKDAYTAAVSAAMNANKAGSYQNYVDLYDATSAAAKNETTYTNNLNKVLAALKAEGVLNNKGREALASYLGSTINPTISNLTSIVTNSAAQLLNNYSAWLDVNDAVIAAEKNAQGFANEYNYNLVLNIAKALQVAVPVLDKTNEQIAQELVGYKGGSTGDGTNKPDDEKDPSAPDTGILSNTEASASTTLAMVAGIATALTAAGAGVVAYRNARRSSRK